MERRDLLSALAGAASLSTVCTGPSAAESGETVSVSSEGETDEASGSDRSTVRVDIVLSGE